MPYYVRYLCLLMGLNLACRENARLAEAREAADASAVCYCYLRRYAAVANSAELRTSGIRTGAGH
ncbi:hypothetical protein Hsw_3047 [Hymenobacter swuensis DY53]|uniref:Uncharacterized protein n=1 Tax=Hymenobacter swuensis DY53 TaxID=1227739 RepID=W8F3P9_9BACT|nr:hypothetical protein Hsw_3047 [Hymenobacter swuensis DY53]